MDIFTIISGGLDNNTYVLTSGDKAIIIDGAACPKDIEKYVVGKKVVGVFLTHGHFDHFENLNAILETFDCKCYMHKASFNKFGDHRLNGSICVGLKVETSVEKSICEFVGEGDVVNIFDDGVKVIALPGHTDCGLGFVVGDKLFTGDTLFARGYGRTDLETSNYGDMKASLKRLFEEYKGYEYFAGHGKSSTIK